MNKTIAVVDDEPDILELVSLHLKKAGFQAKTFLQADLFLRSLNSDTPNLIILDLMLPDTDGFEMCKFLKADDRHSSIPIIMLTARTEETEKVLGLELGADDYVTKPFSPRELIARVKAILRRSETRDETKKIFVGDLILIDLEKFEVMVEGRKIGLTHTEFKILQLLSSKKGWVHSRNQILNFLWGQEKFVIDRTIDVHIAHLKDKLGKAASALIGNVRGMGYRLQE